MLRGPIASLRLLGLYFRVGALNELQYRATLAVEAFQSAIALVTGLAVLGLVFSQTEQLNGWNQAELLAIMGVHTLMGGLIYALIEPNMTRLMNDVREGKLDFVLTKPEDAQVLVSVRQVKIWVMIEVIVGLVILAVAIARLETGLGLVQALAFGYALLLGGLMIYCFLLAITTAAFWIIRMDEVHELFEGLYQSGRWPVSVYPGWLRVMLTFLVPIGFAVTVPAEALTGRLTGETLLLATGFAVLIFAATRWWWRFGLRHYSGASA